MPMFRPALALACLLLSDPGTTGQTPTDARPAELPAGTVAWIAWHDGVRVFEALEALTTRPDLPARVRLALGLARAAAIGATGGVRLEEVAGTLSPGRGMLGVAIRPGTDRPLPFLITEQDDTDHHALEALLDRLPQTVAHVHDDRHLVVSGDRDFTDALRRELAPTPSSEDIDGPLLQGAITAAALHRTPAQHEPGGVLLLGPLQAALQDATNLDFTLDLGADGIRFAATLHGTPLGRGALSALLPHADQPRRLPPAPEGTLATLSLDRSLAHLIRARDDLLRAGEAAQLGGGLTIADALSGGSFVDGILAALDEPFTLFLVAHEPQENGALEPRLLDLPGFVLVAPLRDPEDRSAPGLMERAFGNLMLADGARRRQQELPSFVTRKLRGPGDAEMLVGEPIDWRGPEPWPIETTISPTLSIAFGHVVLASTVEGTRRALQALCDAASGPEDPAGTVVGDHAELDPAALATMLQRNADLLVFDEVMKKGIAPSKARRNFDDLSGVLRCLGPLRMAVEPGPTTTRMVLELRLAR